MNSSTAGKEFVSDTFGGKAKNITILALPIVLANFLMSVGGFISALMLSYVNEKVFAASIIIASVQLAVITVSFSMLFALSAVVSKIVGENDQLDRVGGLVRGGTSLGLIISVPLILICLFIEPILLVVGQDKEVAAICRQYFHIYILCIPATALMNVLQQFLIGVFKQHIVLFMSIFGIVFTASLAYPMIFGKVGFPAMGIEGLAWANVIASWVSLGILAIHMYRQKGYAVYSIFKLKVADLKASMGQVFKVGAPISFQMGNELFSFLITTIMVGWIGLQALEAKQIVTRYLMLLIIPLFGISQAATVLIGRYYGEKSFNLLKSYGWLCIMAGLAYAVFLFILFSVAPESLIEVFNYDGVRDPEFVELVSMLLVLVAVGQLFDSVRNIITGALRGLQDTIFPMMVSIVVIWPVGIPLAYVMGFTMEMGLIGITIAHNISMAISSGILLYRWNKKTKSLSKDESVVDIKPVTEAQ